KSVPSNRCKHLRLLFDPGKPRGGKLVLIPNQQTEIAHPSKHEPAPEPIAQPLLQKPPGGAAIDVNYRRQDNQPPVIQDTAQQEGGRLEKTAENQKAPDSLRTDRVPASDLPPLAP